MTDTTVFSGEVDRSFETSPLDTLPRLAQGMRRHSFPAGEAPAGRYLAVDDLGERRLVPLTQSALHIGRGLRADIRLDDQSVSRSHAIIAMRPDGPRIVDDRSMNGTWVNGRRVTEADLRDGDVIVLGRVVLEYVDTPAASGTTRAA